ncbi:MAG: protease complex subunit PrcB family protein [Planctomycetota bacterium]
MRKLLIPLVAALVAAPFAFIAPALGGPVTVPFTTVAQGSISSWPNGPADIVVKRQTAWARIWSEHAPGTTAPVIDFTQNDVYCCFYGFASTGGHAIEVTGVADNGPSIEVFVDNTSPGANCNVIQIITNPFHFVAVPKQQEPVAFTHNSIILNCP